MNGNDERILALEAEVARLRQELEALRAGARDSLRAVWFEAHGGPARQMAQLARERDAARARVAELEALLREVCEDDFGVWRGEQVAALVPTGWFQRAAAAREVKS